MHNRPFRGITVTVFLLGTACLSGAANNLIPGDSSFETGQIANTFVPYQSFNTTTGFAIDPATASDGKQSLKLEFTQEGNMVFGKEVPVEIGKTYTLSLYARAENDGERAQVSLVNRSWKDHRRQIITLSKEWKRYSLTINAQQSSYAIGFFWLGKEGIGNIWGDGGRRPVREKHLIWIDACQLEEGTVPSPYKNGAPISLGIHISSESDYVFFPDEEIKIDLTAYKAWPETETGDMILSCRITDFSGRTIRNEEERIVLDKDGKFKKVCLFKPEKTGLFIVRAQIEEAVNLMSFAVVKPPVEIEKGMEQFCGVVTRYPYPGLKKIGVSRLENMLLWNEIEAEEGKFDWTSMDQVRRYKENGWKIKTAIYNAAPAWSHDPEETDQARAMKVAGYRLLPSKERLEAWRDFVRQAAVRYKDVIDIWEIGGECDLTVGCDPFYRARYPEAVENGVVLGPVTDRYAEIIEIAAREILSVIPEATVGAIRATGVDAGRHYPFSKDIFKKGVGKTINAFPLDPYCYPRAIGPDLNTLMPDDFLPGFLGEARDITREYGDFSVYLSEFGWSFDKDIEPDSVYAGEMVKRISRTFLIAKNAGMRYCEWFAAVTVGYENSRYSYGLWNNGLPMATVPAYSTVSNVVENATETKEITGLGSGVKAVIFRKSGRADAAVWASTGRGTFTVGVKPGAVSFFDVMGNPLEISAENGGVTFRIDEFPVYLSMKGIAAFEELSGIISSGKILMSPVSISFLTPKITKGFVVLKNQAYQDMTGTVSLQLPGGVELKKQIQIPQKKDFDFETDFTLPQELADRKGEAKIEVNLEGFEKVTASFPMEFEKARKVSFPISIDGDLSEWKNFPCLLVNKRENIQPPDPSVTWRGPEDLSARVYLGWNQKDFYLAAEVTDDRHSNIQKGQKILEGDSFLFALDPYADAALKERSGYNDDDCELGAALTPKGPVSYQWFGKKDCLEGSECAVTRDEPSKKTFYEFRIPVRNLRIFPSEGMIFGFSFAVPNGDKGYWLELTPGIIGARKTPGLFRKFVLVEQE